MVLTADGQGYGSRCEDCVYDCSAAYDHFSAIRGVLYAIPGCSDTAWSGGRYHSIPITLLRAVLQAFLSHVSSLAPSFEYLGYY